MYVFVDMEWISNQRGNHWPTQLAAARVDAHWNTVDTLSTLFRPKDFSFQQWGHMAFSGWNKEQFLNGESLYAGLDAFRHWLQPEDTICWWHQEASDLFNMFSKVSGVPDMTQHVVLLCDYIYGYLAGQEASVGSPYKICAARNIATPSPAHCSANDVATMQLLAQGIGFEQKHLLEPPKRWGNDAMAQKGSSAYKLLYDPQAKLLHQSDCELLPDNRHFPAFLTFKLPIRRKYKPCSCCRDEFLDALWDRNQDSIALNLTMSTPSSPRSFTLESAVMYCWPMIFREPFPTTPALKAGDGLVSTAIRSRLSTKRLLFRFFQRSRNPLRSVL